MQGLIITGLLFVSVPANAATGNDHGYFWQNYVSGGSSSISFSGAGTYPGNFAVSYSNVGTWSQAKVGTQDRLLELSAIILAL
jgi:hypothetical protein